MPVSLPEGNWLLGRQLSVGYYALVDYKQGSPNLYEFNKVNYQKALETGQVLVL